MGFGNAASSFMTGFMAGYKFIDDMEKKEAETKALIQKQKDDLQNKKLELIDKEDERGKKLATDISKINDDVQNNVLTKADSPETALSIINSGEASKKTLINNFNNTSLSKADLLKDTPMLGYVAQNVDFRDGGFVSMTSDNGSTFIAPRGNLLGTILQGDLSRKEANREYFVDKDGYVFKKAEGGQILRVASDGTTFIPDPELPSQKQAQLATIDNLPYKFKDPTDNTPYPQNKIDDALKARLKSVGMIPDASGNFPNLTYGEVQNANKALMGAYTFEAKPMYSSDGKTIISVTNRDEYDKALANGYSPNKPEKMTIPDIKLQQYFKSDAFKKGLTYDYWESEETEKGKTSNVVTAIGASEVLKGGGVVKDAAALERRAIPSMTTEEKKQISDFKTKTNSFKIMEQQLNSLDKLIESGNYKKDIIQTFLTDLGKTAPESMMNVFGSKEALIKTYKMDAQLAGIVFDIIKADSGLTVTDAERKARMEAIFGGIFSNTTTRRETFQSFLKRTSDQLNLEADTIAGFGGVDTAQQWINYYKMISKKTSMQSKYDNNSGTKQNTPEFTDPISQSVYSAYKYEPFLVNIKTGERIKYNSKYNSAEFKAYILNPHTKKVERVK